MTRLMRREPIQEVVRLLRAEWLAVCLCLAAGVIGGAFGSYRAAYGFDAAIVDWHGLEPTQVDGIGPVRWMTRVATMKMVAPDWRPMSVVLDLIAQEDAGTISVEADGWPIGSFRPAPDVRHTRSPGGIFPPSARSSCCASFTTAPRLSASRMSTSSRASRRWDASATGSAAL
jgi:hypothetical protein